MIFSKVSPKTFSVDGSLDADAVDRSPHDAPRCNGIWHGNYAQSLEEAQAKL